MVGLEGKAVVKICGIIQARDNSTRLPGKALLDLNGMPMIQHVLNRVRAVKSLDSVVVSTSVDSPRIVKWCKRNDIDHFVGSETDLLSRHLSAAITHKADAILRATADCPFHDPALLEQHIRNFRKCDVDLYTNWGNGRAVSEGLDCALATVQGMQELGGMKCDREDWITWAIDRDAILQRHASSDDPQGADLHLSVDTPIDLEMAREMLNILGLEQYQYVETLKAYEQVRSA